jgi:hypothetical protein
MAHLKLNTTQWLQLGKKLGYIDNGRMKVAQGESLQGKYGTATETKRGGDYLYLGLDIVYNHYPPPGDWTIGRALEDGPDGTPIDSAESPEECIKIMDDLIESEILDENETGLSEQEVEQRIDQWFYDDKGSGGSSSDDDFDTRTLDEQFQERWDRGGHGDVHRG